MRPKRLSHQEIQGQVFVVCKLNLKVHTILAILGMKIQMSENGKKGHFRAVLHKNSNETFLVIFKHFGFSRLHETFIVFADL